MVDERYIITKNLAKVFKPGMQTAICFVSYVAADHGPIKVQMSGQIVFSFVS
jgi:hypothetical protein